MGAYIAILRGINVSGARPLPMKELKVLFEELGAQAVSTYIQSGNVVFTHAKLEPAAFAKQVAERIKAQFGHDVPVLVRSVEDWRAVVKRNPFVKQNNVEADKLHVTFLDAEGTAAGWEKIAAGTYGADAFRPDGLAIYLHCPNGYGNTKLNNGFFESKLKVTATTRNWRTVNELLRMAEAL